MINTKNKLSLVFGVLGFLLTLAIAIVFFYAYLIGSIFSFGEVELISLLVSSFALIVCAIIIIVALIFCLKRAKVSGILFAITNAINLGLIIYILIDCTEFYLGYILLGVDLIILVTAMALAFTSIPKNKDIPQIDTERAVLEKPIIEDDDTAKVDDI